MSFISVLFALLLEQARPLSRGNLLHTAARVWMAWCAGNLDAGRAKHGWLAWSVAVAIPVVMTESIFYLSTAYLGWPFALLWTVAVLYVCLGFRQFSFHFTEIRSALAQGDMAQARALLADWQKLDPTGLTDRVLVGRVVEASTLAAHRHVFGVLTWFAIGAALGLGPTGAVLYRMAEMLARSWQAQDHLNLQPLSPALELGARAMWQRIDWLPARLTAISFAVVGNFEDALDGWRRWGKWQQEGQSKGLSEDQDGLILAATSGALGLQLPSVDFSGDDEGLGGKVLAESEHLAAVVGLVWRTVVMWMVLLALLTLARLLA